MHKSKGLPLAIFYTVSTPCLFNIPLLISFVAYCINGVRSLLCSSLLSMLYFIPQTPTRLPAI